MKIRSRVIGSLFSATALVAVSAPAFAESRSYVVSMFAPASYNKDGDCSKGVNIPVGEQYELDLLAAGYTKEQVEQLKTSVDDTTMFGGYNTAWARAVIFRGKINGKQVNAWVNPASALDPGLHMIDGPTAVGFDLDGKGADQPTGFEDPFTKVKGVDNQFFRATGCLTVFRGDDKTTPGAYESAWTVIQGGMPAWLITLTGEDLSKDGDVTVTFDVAVDHVERDALSKVLRDMTFRVSTDPRNHHELAGTIKNGMVTLKQPGDILAVFGEEMAYPKVQLSKAQLRFELKQDGTLRGVIGGYQPWKDALSAGNQANMGSDWVGVYWNLRRSADSNPDPKTGENRDISNAYFVDAVPAFAVSTSATAGKGGKKSASR